MDTPRSEKENPTPRWISDRTPNLDLSSPPIEDGRWACDPYPCAPQHARMSRQETTQRRKRDGGEPAGGSAPGSHHPRHSLRGNTPFTIKRWVVVGDSSPLVRAGGCPLPLL